MIDLVVVEELYSRFPDKDPGDLSLLKQCVVCNKSLALVALKYDLDDLLFIEYEEEIKKI